MRKFCRSFFLWCLSALLMLSASASAAALPGGYPPAWQAVIIMPDGTEAPLPLNNDYTEDGVEYTLAAPYLPLRPLAQAAGLKVSWRKISGYSAVLWPSTQGARVFVAARPLALHIYKEETEQTDIWAAAAETRFEYPRLLNGSFCVPLSFLDCLGIACDADAEKGVVRVYVPAVARADADVLWQAAEPLLKELLAPPAEVIGAATTFFNSKQINRSQNILLAAGALHGLVIPPGEEFSFNRAVGPRTVARGYRPAPVFSGGSAVDGLGGGICQVSTTVYQAALAAGLKITERYPHSLPVSYSAEDADAAVVWGAKDLRWQNTCGSPVQISCTIEGGSLTVRLYKLKDEAAADAFLGLLAQ